AANPYKTEIVEPDTAVMTLADVPEQHGLAKTIVGCLGEGAGAGNRAAAIVKPVTDDMPARNLAHWRRRGRGRVQKIIGPARKSELFRENAARAPPHSLGGSPRLQADTWSRTETFR